MAEHDLDAIYREAQAALKSRDYVRAGELLRQILVVDENYKDVSRLLANVVKLKRRRWYSHPALWGALGFVILIGLGIWLSKVLPRETATSPLASTVTPSTTAIPATATITLTPTATPIPLTWKRISMGLEFPRDTVTAFATDKKDADVIYAAMKNAGVYKTIDGGLSWFPAHHGLESTQVESLLIDSQNPQILYAGTLGGVFKTEDGGGNWYRIGDGTYLLIDLQDNSHLYARDENGIYETKDKGITWATVYALNKDCPDVIHSWAIHPADGDMLFTGGGETCAGVYQSNNSGNTWTLIGDTWALSEDSLRLQMGDMSRFPHDIHTSNVYTLAIGLDEGGNFSVYAGYISSFLEEYEVKRASVSHGHTSVSYNGGANWLSLDNGCSVLISDPVNLSTIYCAHQNWGALFRGGKGSAWQRIPGLETSKISAINIDRQSGTEQMIVGSLRLRGRTNDGVFLSTDGGTSWSTRNGGLGLARSELKIDPMDAIRMYLASYFPGEATSVACVLDRSQDGGKSWSLITDVIDWCGPAFDATNALYQLESDALQKSFDGGETWLWDLSSDNSQPWADIRAKYLAHKLPAEVQSISANPYMDGLAYAVGDEIYYSTDTGTSWKPSADSEGSWDARLFYTDQSKTIYAIGRYHQKYSTDNGKTWENCGEDVTASRSDSRLALDLQGSRLYLATPGQGVMLSTDNCGSWQASNNGLRNLFVNTLAIDPNNPNMVYAGTDGGAYISFDSGVTWGQVNDGLLGATVVYSIVVDKDSNVYAATPYGVFKLEGK